MKINGIDIGGGEFSPTQLTDWTTRLAGSHSEGDYAVWTATGAVYQWSASLRSGSGDWIRTEAYTSSYGHEAYLDGDEANDAAILTKGWDSISESGAGAVTYDGTRIVLTGVSTGAGTDSAAIQRSASTTIVTSSTIWACGLYQFETSSSSWTGRFFDVRDGTYMNKFANAAGSFQRIEKRPSNDYDSGREQRYGAISEGQFSSSTEEKHLALHITPYTAADNIGVVKLWINHSLDPYYLGARNQVTNATTIIQIRAGDLNTGNSGRGAIIKVRDYTAGAVI